MTETAQPGRFRVVLLNGTVHTAVAGVRQGGEWQEVVIDSSGVAFVSYRNDRMVRSVHWPQTNIAECEWESL